jgi:hypothetical protein
MRGPMDKGTFVDPFLFFLIPVVPRRDKEPMTNPTMIIGL